MIEVTLEIISEQEMSVLCGGITATTYEWTWNEELNEWVWEESKR